MEEQCFDVIIPVSSKDVGFVHRVIDFVFRCLPNVNKVYLLVSLKLETKILKTIRKYGDKCEIVDENKLVPGLSFESVKRLLCEKSDSLGNKTGWYFQQFLKLAFSRSKYSSQYYLSWDADTLPLAKIEFFEDNHILFNPKAECHNAYFSTIKKLLGFGKVVDYSFISEHMLFSSKIVRELLDDIESSSILGKNWFDKIINACNFEESDLAFSEFETYGSYCSIKYPGLYKGRHLNTFREAGLICGRYISNKKLQQMSFDVDVASFEMIHSPMFPYNFPNIIYNIKNRKFNYILMPLMILLNKICFCLRRNKVSTSSQNGSQDVIFRLPPQN